MNITQWLESLLLCYEPSELINKNISIFFAHFFMIFFGNPLKNISQVHNFPYCVSKKGVYSIFLPSETSGSIYRTSQFSNIIPSQQVDILHSAGWISTTVSLIQSTTQWQSSVIVSRSVDRRNACQQIFTTDLFKFLSVTTRHFYRWERVTLFCCFQLNNNAFW